MALEEIGAKLTLKDRRQFSAEAAAAAASTRELGEAAKSASNKASMSSAPTGGFGLLRATFGFVATAAKTGIVALAGAAVAAVGFGIKTRASMEQAQIGFTTMLGSATQAQSFMEDITKFARETPFQLADVVTGSQRLLAMGFAAKEVLPTLTSVGDAAAGLGLGAEGLDRIITAIGQIRVKGTLQAEEMRQLAEAGIPAWDFLAKKLGTDIPHAMDMVTQRSVTSSTAITAITEGMNAKFGGLMEKQSHTITGIWSNIKDTVSQGLSGMILPFQDDLKSAENKVLDFANNVFKRFPDIAANIRRQVPKAWAALQSSDAGGVAAAIDSAFGAGGHLVPTMTKVVGLGLDFWKLLKDGIIPAFGAMKDAIPIDTLTVASGLMGFLADHATIAGPAIVGIAATYYGIRTAINLVQGAIKIATGLQWLWNVAADANPYVLLSIAFAVLAIEIYMAYKKFDAFRRLVDNTARWIKDHWKEAIVVGLGGPIVWVADLVLHNWKLITDGARSMVDKVENYLLIIPRAISRAVRFGFDLVTRPVVEVLDLIRRVYGWLADRIGGLIDKATSLKDATVGFVAGDKGQKGVLGKLLDFMSPATAGASGFLSDRLHDIGIPGFASGGVVMARPGGTLALLGEGGRNEAVIPLSRRGEVGSLGPRLSELAGGTGRRIDTIEVPVNINGREITRIVIDGLQDRAARQ